MADGPAQSGGGGFRRKARDDEMRRPRNVALTFLLVTGLVLALLVGRRTLSTPKELSLNELEAYLAQGKEGPIRKILVEGSSATVYYREESEPFKGGVEQQAIAFLDTEHARLVSDKASARGVEVYTRGTSTWFVTFLFTVVPWLAVLGFLYFFLFRQMRAPGAPGGVLTFGKSRARLASREKTGVTFADVAGIDEAKDEVRELIEFLKNPEKFKRLGGRIPRGVMLVGAPGTGKTLLAKAIAGEADVPFFSICGSDFVEMFVGVGASRVRDLFRQARENSPCIIFLDEIDAVGRKRGSGLGGGHDEREQTLNAILVEMDGFDTDEGIIIIASTNRPDVLDPALLRPGRFDREISIDLPDVKGREEILKVHARNVKLAADVDLKVVARGTPGFSGADLEATINEAAILAAMKGKDQVERDDLEESRDKVKWGRKKESRVMEESDRRVTAYHEAGHALVASLLDEVEPLHKVTIIPRGMSLGATMTLPEKDKYHLQKKEVLGNLSVLYGGRIAEAVTQDDISSGAANDIKRATDIARAMVCEWGMSEALGPVSYDEEEETLFLGREIARTRNHSEATEQLIDKEVRAILDAAYKRAEKLIAKNRDKLDKIAAGLMRFETLSGREVEELIKGREIDDIRRDDASAPSLPARASRLAP